MERSFRKHRDSHRTASNRLGSTLAAAPLVFSLGDECCQPRTSATHYCLRSSEALPLCTSKGTELCPCVAIHMPSILRAQTIARYDLSIFCSLVVVAVTRLRLWQKATVPACGDIQVANLVPHRPLER